jgi:hypothetical protein
MVSDFYTTSFFISLMVFCAYVMLFVHQLVWNKIITQNYKFLF